ncbi:MAG: DUF3592 domain-containing protein [Pseudomonadota bacterium]
MERLWNCNGLTWAAIGPILIAVGFIGMAWQPFVNAPRERALEERGIETKATLQKIERSRTSFSSRRRRRRSRRKAHFEFKTRSGEIITHAQNVSIEFAAKHKIGDSVVVVYDPRNPKVYDVKIGSRVDSHTSFWVLAGLTAIGFVVTACVWYEPNAAARA